MSVTPGTYNFPPVARGDSFGELTIGEDNAIVVAPYRFSINVNLSDAVVTMQFRSSIKASAAYKSLTSAGDEAGISLSEDPDNAGKWIIEIKPFIAEFPAGTMYYDIQISTPAPDISTSTIISGTVPVLNDITR